MNYFSNNLQKYYKTAKHTDMMANVVMNKQEFFNLFKNSYSYTNFYKKRYLVTEITVAKIKTIHFYNKIYTEKTLKKLFSKGFELSSLNNGANLIWFFFL